MKQTVKRVLCALAALCLMCGMAACGDSSDVTITKEDGESSTQTKATVAVPKGQLTLSILLGWMSEDLRWSDLNMYMHTLTDDTHAVFAVADGYGKECTLNVTFDAPTDDICEAVLSYGDTSVSVLTDDTMVIRIIMQAMNEG